MYKVKLDPGHTAQEDQIKYGYLAYCGTIQKYGIREAKKEAELFGGHIEKRQKKEEITKEDIKFLELNITIRADSIDDIIGLIPKATGEFLRGGKIGSWCGDTSNYEFRLSER